MEDAIQLALQSRWQEAADLNQDLLERFPPDEETYNRLGKALLELGRLEEAVAAYGRSLELNPLNQIAARQLRKLEELRGAEEVVPATASELDVNVFTEEPGRTAVTRVVLPEGDSPIRVSPGDPLTLELVEDRLVLRTARGVDLGTVEPKLARRVLRLVRQGNRYDGAVTHVDESGIQVILREAYQDPSLAGTLSFPIRKTREAEYRPYAKEPLLRREPVVAIPDLEPVDAPAVGGDDDELDDPGADSGLDEVDSFEDDDEGRPEDEY